MKDVQEVGLQGPVGVEEIDLGKLQLGLVKDTQEPQICLEGLERIGPGARKKERKCKGEGEKN